MQQQHTNFVTQCVIMRLSLAASRIQRYGKITGEFIRDLFSSRKAQYIGGLVLTPKLTIEPPQCPVIRQQDIYLATQPYGHLCDTQKSAKSRT